MKTNHPKEQTITSSITTNPTITSSLKPTKLSSFKKPQSTIKHSTTLTIPPKNLNINSFSQLPPSSPSSKYDIPFRYESSKFIITSKQDIKNPKSKYSINTLCKDYHKCVFKKRIKNHYTDFIDLVSDKMKLTNRNIKTSSEAYELCMEDNLKRMFERDELLKKSDYYKKHIALEKEAITKLKQQLLEIYSDTKHKEIESMQLQEQIIKMNEDIKQLKPKIEEQMKENKILSDQFKSYHDQVIKLRQILFPQPNKFDLFVKDIAKLISAK